MKLLIAAVGMRQPGWVDAGFDEYRKRMPRELPLQLVEVKAEPRSTGKSVEAMKSSEAGRIRAALPERCRVVALDERGGEATTRGLADRLQFWMREGDDVAFVIGGPDGLDDAFKAQASECLRISGLTLPHGLVRIMLAEALYRAVSLMRGHPYHRE